MVPKPLGIGRPPASGAPPGAVWQAAQSAASARYFPRATTSGAAFTTCIGPPVLPDRRFLIGNAAAAMPAMTTAAAMTKVRKRRTVMCRPA